MIWPILCLDIVRVACAADDDGVLLVDLDLTCAAELCELGVLELKTEFVADDLAAGEDSDIAEHFLASVAESRSLDRDAGEGAAELVENEGGESFAFDVLSDDEELLALL